MLNFRESTLVELEKSFGVKELFDSQSLQEWLTAEIEISES